MAFFNKIFPKFKIQQSNNTNNNNSNEDISVKSISNEKKIRVVLFRECDFRGRKLLFDSETIEKIPILEKENENKFIEISNGFGYLLISKNEKNDYGQLSEMIFGSLAMSFRGTYLKIHRLEFPYRLMFTQVFQSPHHTRKISGNSSSNQSYYLSTRNSLVHSIKSDYESGSNISDRLSNRSTRSDTFLVCRRIHSSPLDVPSVKFESNNNSLVIDSGCPDVDNSYFSSSFISTDGTFPLWETVLSHHHFSSSLKRLFRSSTRSLNKTSISLTNSSEILHSKSHQTRNGKLGLTIIVEMPEEHEKFLTQFLMEHIAIVEALIWRNRRIVEMAYHKRSTFISLMFEAVENVRFFFVNLLTVPSSSSSSSFNNLWHCLSLRCDTNLNAFMHNLEMESFKLCKKIREENYFNYGERKFLTNNNINNNKTDNQDEENQWNSGKFIKEFCEIIQNFDTKETNFFISTLLTAVLTYHLGWVATVYPVPSNNNNIKENLLIDQPFNAMWSQLCDLYGAVGYPLKSVQTIICGTNNKTLIRKLIRCLTYFIRYTNIERINLCRNSVDEENKRASLMCLKNNCIPKENFKKYEDHLKELLPDAEENLSQVSSSSSNNNSNNNKLTRIKSCTALTKFNSNSKLSFDQKKNQQNFCVLDDDDEKENNKSQVIFVLGDDESLIDLKAENSGAKRKISQTKKLIQKDHHEQQSDSNNKCKTFLLHTSSSYERLCDDDDDDDDEKIPPTSVRAQSEPPEIRKIITPPANNKYQYSRVKFNLQQYPQVVKNYMKSKNIELEGLSLGEKVFDKFATVQHNIKLDLSGYDSDSEEIEALQTPSNASELEFSPDMGNKEEISAAEENMKIVNLPMPQSKFSSNSNVDNYYFLPYSATIIKSLLDFYLPDMVLQGISRPKNEWEFKLKANLSLTSQHSLLDQPISEALAIVANTDTWEVQLISSHTYVINKETDGVRAGMSELVSNMLDSLMEMWKLKIPTKFCLLHIEQKLQEICVRSKAMAELLLQCEFCSIETLISALKVEINDIPLLMGAASTYMPEVTQKYGLSVQ